MLTVSLASADKQDMANPDLLEELMRLADTEGGGALIGAIAGAVIGIVVSRWSVRYDRRIVACSAIQAFADEAEFNAHVLQHLQEHPDDIAPSALERQAFDAALPILHVLPPRLRDRARNARSNVLIMMYLEERLDSTATNPDAAASSLMQKRQELVDTLPKEFRELASEIRGFVAKDCETWWTRFRPSSSH